MYELLLLFRFLFPCSDFDLLLCCGSSASIRGLRDTVNVVQIQQRKYQTVMVI